MIAARLYEAAASLYEAAAAGQDREIRLAVIAKGIRQAEDDVMKLMPGGSEAPQDFTVATAAEMSDPAAAAAVITEALEVVAAEAEAVIEEAYGQE